MKLVASSRALVAGVVWVAVGVMLVWRGVDPYWLSTLDASAAVALLVLAAGLVLGGAKGWFVLRRSAGRVIARIEANPGPQPVWLIYPPYLWLLIPLMIALGLGLKAAAGDDLPALVAGVYVGIGAALMVSSVPYFQAARRLRSGEAGRQGAAAAGPTAR